MKRPRKHIVEMPKGKNKPNYNYIYKDKIPKTYEKDDNTDEPDTWDDEPLVPEEEEAEDDLEDDEQVYNTAADPDYLPHWVSTTRSTMPGRQPWPPGWSTKSGTVTLGTKTESAASPKTPLH
jgi:hypothetical protein